MDEREAFAKRAGQMLARMRKVAGLTQEDLAVRLGKSHSYVTRLETAVRGTDLADMYLWARACELDVRQYAAILVDDEGADHAAARDLTGQIAMLHEHDRALIADLVLRLQGATAPK